MQHPKPFFEIFEKLLVCGVQRHITSGNKIFSIKAATFSLIFIPCLLQFPFIASGQDGANVIDGGLMTTESNRKSVLREQVVADGGYLGGEGGFIFLDGGTDNISLVSPQGKPMGGQHPKQDASDSEQRDVTLAHWTKMLLLFFGAWVAISPTVEKK